MERENRVLFKHTGGENNSLPQFYVCIVFACVLQFRVVVQNLLKTL